MKYINAKELVITNFNVSCIIGSNIDFYAKQLSLRVEEYSLIKCSIFVPFLYYLIIRSLQPLHHSAEVFAIKIPIVKYA